MSLQNKHVFGPKTTLQAKVICKNLHFISSDCFIKMFTFSTGVTIDAYILNKAATIQKRRADPYL